MEKLQTLFSALVWNRQNMNMLHWHIKSDKFDPVHELFGDYGDQFTGFIDDVAEICLMFGTKIPTLQEVLSSLQDTDTQFINVGYDKTEYSSDEAFTVVEHIFSNMLNLYEDACDDLPDDVESKLHEHMYWIRKELQYKNPRRK